VVVIVIEWLPSFVGVGDVVLVVVSSGGMLGAVGSIWSVGMWVYCVLSLPV